MTPWLFDHRVVLFWRMKSPANKTKFFQMWHCVTTVKKGNQIHHMVIWSVLHDYFERYHRFIRLCWITSLRPLTERKTVLSVHTIYPGRLLLLQSFCLGAASRLASPLRKELFRPNISGCLDFIVFLSKRLQQDNEPGTQNQFIIRGPPQAASFPSVLSWEMFHAHNLSPSYSCVSGSHLGFIR